MRLYKYKLVLFINHKKNVMNLHIVFKSLMFLAAASLLFSCGENEVTTNSSSDGCPELAFTYSNEVNDYYFEADFPEIETLFWYGWTINGEVAEEEGTTVNGDNLFETSFSTAGSYEVCIFTETPDCPEGTEYCETIVVESDSTPPTGCPEMSLVYTESPSEHQFAVSFPNEDNSDQVFWTVNGAYVGDGLIYAVDFSTPGAYEICAGIETPDCPEGVFACHTVVVEEEGPGDGCPEFEISFTQNGVDFVFTASYSDSIDWYGWAVDGEIIEEEGNISNGDDIFNYSFDDVGTYTVCILHESSTCTYLEECIEVVVE
ncbi:MAG: hypothetical protein ACI94Y_003680 [Maribacter sp.]|jgi:hypothetical protein